MAICVQILSLLCFCILSVLELRFHGTDKERFFKPLLMPLLIVFYLSSALAMGREIRFLLIPALIGGFLGDTFLLRDEYFIPGLLSFLAGHIFYIADFWRNIKVTWLRPIPVIVFVMIYLLYMILVVQKLFPGMDARAKAPVSLYIGIILAMSFSSYLMYMNGKTTGRMVTWVGTMLFLVSDTILSFQIFHKKSGAWVMPTYLAAQFLIVLGALM